MKPKIQTLFLAISIFCLSLLLHLINLNHEGRMWDEQFKVDLGVLAIKNIFKGNYALKHWNHGTEHPYGSQIHLWAQRLSTL